MRNVTLVFALAWLAGAPTAAAQHAPDVRIEVDDDGLYEVRWQDLAPHLDARELEADRLTLMRAGVEVPILLRSTSAGRFGRTSSLIFYGERLRSGHSRRASYRLTYGPGTARIHNLKTETTGPPRSEVWVTATFERDEVFDPMKTVREDLLDLPAGERRHWFWRRLPPPPEERPGEERVEDVASLPLRLSPPARIFESFAATLEIRVRSHLGRSCRQSMSVELGGRQLGEASWDDPRDHTVTFEVPARQLKSLMVLRVRNTSKQRFWTEAGNQVQPRSRNDILIDSVRLRYPTLLTAPTARDDHLVYDVEPPRDGKPVDYRFVNFREDSYRIFDVSRRAFLESSQVHVSGRRPHRFIAVERDGFKKAHAIDRWSRRDLRREREGGDWVVVTLERLASSVPLLTRLRARQGLKPYVVTDREVYDSFSNGDFTPDAIQRFIHFACDAWQTKPRYLLLVGDADRDVDWVSEKSVLPTAMVTTYYNGLTASDDALVAGASQPVAVGRIAVRREDDLLRVIRKIRRYETETSYGPWQKRLNFIGSEGRFGPLVDPLIEAFATRMLSCEIPASYDVTMTYASPTSAYLFPPARFNEKVISRFNEGALVYTYIGHGFTKGFDMLRVGRKRFPILTSDHLGSIDAGDHNPVMAIIACSTAHFDDPRDDCIGEELLAHPGGPIAVIGSTRISHPFPNALLGEEFIKSFFSHPDARLGDALRLAKDGMLAGWSDHPINRMAGAFMGKLDRKRLMEDHRHLYVLLGDPALKVAHPRAAIALEAAESIALGEAVEVTGAAEGLDGATVTVTIEAGRDRIVRPVERVSVRKEESYETIERNYEAANDKVIASGSATVSGGRFAVELTIDGDFPPGDYAIKAFAVGQGSSVMGSRPLTLKKKGL